MEKFAVFGIVTLFAALPATSTYRLNSYGFGSGGTANSKTSTYSLEGSTGELSGKTGLTATYKSKPGFTETQQANVPKLAALDTNGGQYYNKLHFVIDNQANPTDAKFLLAVSSDNFVTDTKYLQPDGTLATTLALADYQTYAAWGGSSGGLIIGLLPGTSYSVKLKATQGQFSESAYGPATTLATASPSLTFDIVTNDVSTGTPSTPALTAALGTLTAGNVSTTAQNITSTFSTNGTSGGSVYLAGKNGGLLSASTGYKINAVSNDLTGLSEGFGAQNSTISQTSGGPFTVVSPYNVSGANVGIVGGIIRSLYSSTLPINGGSGVLLLKAKSATNSVAASDYKEILTFVAAGNF